MVSQGGASYSWKAVPGATLRSLLVPMLFLALSSQSGAADESIEGVWKGSYVCGQGTTGLTLEIEGADPSRLTARFRFYPVPENPSVPSGEFEMVGGYDPSTGKFELLPGEWINRPYGYTMVGLTGELDSTKGTLAGRVSSGCKTFALAAQENLQTEDQRATSEDIASREGASSAPETVATVTSETAQAEISAKAGAADDCDRLAASPLDPQRTQGGVAFDQVDAVAAINACRRAVEADSDNARLQYQYGRSLTKGQNHPEAWAWNRKAADQGYAAAQYNLGVMYSEGAGIPQDHAEAAEWYRKAADQGFVLAQHQLGLMYLNGTGVAQDHAEAAEWYRKAADQGFALAQSQLGLMHIQGTGVPQDDAEALKWYQLAADQGDALAQSNLGWMYGAGRGVPRDDAEAMRWYRKAADQGHAVAQYNLGLLIEQGVDAPPNALEAARWYELAAAQGHAEAIDRLELQEERGSLEEQKRAIENNLGSLRANQEVLDQDVERLKKEVAQGELLIEAAKAEAAEDYARAEEILRALCDDENADACEWLEEAY